MTGWLCITSVTPGASGSGVAPCTSIRRQGVQTGGPGAVFLKKPLAVLTLCIPRVSQPAVQTHARNSAGFPLGAKGWLFGIWQAGLVLQ